MISPDPASTDPQKSTKSPVKKPLAYVYSFCLFLAILAIAPFYMKAMHLMWDYNLLKVVLSFFQALLSWPVLAGIIVIIFREHFKTLLKKAADRLGDLESVEAKGIKFNLPRPQADAIASAKEAFSDILQVDFTKAEFSRDEYIDSLSRSMQYLAAYLEAAYTHPIGVTQMAYFDDSFILLETLLKKLETEKINFPKHLEIRAAYERILSFRNGNPYLMTFPLPSR